MLSRLVVDLLKRVVLTIIVEIKINLPTILIYGLDIKLPVKHNCCIDATYHECVVEAGGDVEEGGVEKGGGVTERQVRRGTLSSTTLI